MQFSLSVVVLVLYKFVFRSRLSDGGYRLEKQSGEKLISEASSVQVKHEEVFAV